MSKQDLIAINKFYVSLHIACEYFEAIEKPLKEMFDTQLQTQYKEMFSSNRKDKRRFEKLYKEDIQKFNARLKAFKGKSKSLLGHFDTLKDEDIDEAINSNYDHLDTLFES